MTDEMVTIDNRDVRQLRCCGVVLQRGKNKVPAAKWEEMSGHPFVKARMGSVLFATESSTPVARPPVNEPPDMVEDVARPLAAPPTAKKGKGKKSDVAW